MTDEAAARPPSAPLDEELYASFGGAAAMGEPVPDEIGMELGLALPEDRAEAMHPLAQRRDRILDLLERHRDLRLYIRLFETETRLRGIEGCHASLHLLHAVLTKFWEEIHPAPPEEGDARIARMTAFGVLRQKRLIWRLDETVVFDAGGLDREITLRAFYIATEQHAKTRRFPPRETETLYPVEGLRGVIARADKAEAVAQAHAALVSIAALLRALGAFLGNCEGYQSIRLDDLAKDVDIYADALAPFLSEPVGAGEPEAAPEEGAAEDAPAAAQPQGQPAGAAKLATREDAAALIDAVLAYYAANARSSPVALGLLKLRSMMDHSFEDWMNEVAPDWPERAALSLVGADMAGFASAGEGASAPSPALGDELDALDAAIAGLREEGEPDPARIEAVEAAAAALRAAAAPSATAVEGAAAPQIGSTADVRAALKRLAAYFRAAEPSSPAYLCFEKMLELVDRGFLDILHRIAPRGVGSASLVLAEAEPDA